MKYKIYDRFYAIQRDEDGTAGLSIWEHGKKEFIPIDDKIPGLSLKLVKALEAAYISGKQAKADELKEMLRL